MGASLANPVVGSVAAQTSGRVRPDSSAQKAVVFATVVLFALVIYTRSRAGKTGQEAKDAYTQLFAVGVLAVILSFIADFAPEVAVPFSVAVVVGYCVRNRKQLGPLFGETAPAAVRTAAKTAPKPGLTPNVPKPQPASGGGGGGGW